MIGPTYDFGFTAVFAAAFAGDMPGDLTAGLDAGFTAGDNAGSLWGGGGTSLSSASASSFLSRAAVRPGAVEMSLRIVVTSCMLASIRC